MSKNRYLLEYYHMWFNEGMEKWDLINLLKKIGINFQVRQIVYTNFSVFYNINYFGNLSTNSSIINVNISGSSIYVGSELDILMPQTSRILHNPLTVINRIHRDTLISAISCSLFKLFPKILIKDNKLIPDKSVSRTSLEYAYAGVNFVLKYYDHKTLSHKNDKKKNYTNVKSEMLKLTNKFLNSMDFDSVQLPIISNYDQNKKIDFSDEAIVEKNKLLITINKKEFERKYVAVLKELIHKVVLKNEKLYGTPIPKMKRETPHMESISKKLERLSDPVDPKEFYKGNFDRIDKSVLTFNADREVDITSLEYSHRKFSHSLIHKNGKNFLDGNKYPSHRSNSKEYDDEMEYLDSERKRLFDQKVPHSKNPYLYNQLRNMEGVNFQSEFPANTKQEWKLLKKLKYERNPRKLDKFDLNPENIIIAPGLYSIKPEIKRFSLNHRDSNNYKLCKRTITKKKKERMKKRNDKLEYSKKEKFNEKDLAIIEEFLSNENKEDEELKEVDSLMRNFVFFRKKLVLREEKLKFVIPVDIREFMLTFDSVINHDFARYIRNEYKSVFKDFLNSARF
jgi:hypothetical protein